MKGGRVVNDIVANIDIAPTFLALAGAKTDAKIDGMSFADQLMGRAVTGKPRTALNYEYYWEYI